MSVTERLPVIPVDDLVPCCGFCCCFHSLITSNYCCGCYGRITIPCLLIEQSFCRPIKNDSVYCCTLGKSECSLGYTKVCCQLESQCCCWDWRCSLPQREAHPCILNALFLNCCYKFQWNCHCCHTIKTLDSFHIPPAPLNRALLSSGPTMASREVERGEGRVAAGAAAGSEEEGVGIVTAEVYPVMTSVLAEARIER